MQEATSPVLLRTRLAIRQKSREPRFWEVINSYFISKCKFFSFKNPFATNISLSKLYFRFRRYIMLVQNKENDFCELWQLRKQLKTMEVNEAWPLSDDLLASGSWSLSDEWGLHLECLSLAFVSKNIQLITFFYLYVLSNPLS